MATVLIVYGTTEGQTVRIAARIADEIRRKGVGVQTLDARDVPTSSPLTGFDAVIVGGSIHHGHYEDYLLRWVSAHDADLVRMPSAFFSVCLSSARPIPENLARVDQYLEKFSQETSWRPAIVGKFAGALLYTRYSRTKRLLMWQLTRHIGGPVDTSRDYEFTDWAAVTHFADAVLESMLVHA